MKLQKDLKEFVALLNSHGVEYLVVGGHAVAFHGYPRYTGDIDFFLKRDFGNATKDLRVLKEFGFESLQVLTADLMGEDKIIQLGVPPNRIDLLTSLSGISYDEAHAGRMAGNLDGLPVFFIGLSELLRNKRASGRPKDLGDVGELEGR